MCLILGSDFNGAPTSLIHFTRRVPSMTLTCLTTLLVSLGSTQVSLSEPSEMTSSLSSAVMPQPSPRGVLNVPTCGASRAVASQKSTA